MRNLGLRLVCGVCLLGTADLAAAQNESATITALTMSDVRQILRAVGEEVIRELPQELAGKVSGREQEYLEPLASYLDLHVIGAGRSVDLDIDYIKGLVQQSVAEGRNAEVIGRYLVEEYRRNGLKQMAAVQNAGEGITTRIGGYFATEFELHQEPNGDYAPLLEINQARIYISSHFDSASRANQVRFLGEWNPVPEEVIHQIDEITFNRADARGTLKAPEVEIEGLIQFEQLYVAIDNLLHSGVNLTIGQFRNPFGLWSDYTSHRNFTSSKNNMLVNGFALKKVELGILTGMDLDSGLSWRAALVHGRRTRTAPLDRADLDDGKDLVAQVGYQGASYRVGGSIYLSEFQFNNLALGVDWLALLGPLVLSGELVYQRNDDVNGTFGTTFGFDVVQAQSGYVQGDWSITSTLHLYGLYELWRYVAGDEQVGIASKVFHGLRFQASPNLRWVVTELGWMFHDGFDEGNLHLSTQLELTF